VETNTVKLPIDLLQLPPFRKLRTKLHRAGEANGVEQALLIWWVLFQDLKYRAQEGGPAGRMPKADQQSFLSELATQFEETAHAVKIDEIIPTLVELKILIEDGEDYVCTRYAVLNGEGSAGRTNAQRGGDMRAYDHRARKLGEATLQQSLQIADSKLVDDEGLPLPAEEVRRITRLVVACDNALFKPLRPSPGFTEGLIQSARTVLKKYTDEEIDQVCRIVAMHRNHPALNGITTERLLPVFGEMIRKLE